MDANTARLARAIVEAMTGGGDAALKEVGEATAMLVADTAPSNATPRIEYDDNGDITLISYRGTILKSTEDDEYTLTIGDLVVSLWSAAPVEALIKEEP